MKVLVIEDDAAIAGALCRGLEAEDFVTEVADNGVDGLWLAQQGAVDLVLLDIMIPGLSGYEVCRRLRAGGSQVPVLMLTAKDGDHDQADALDLGADGFLSKPFAFVVLLAHIRALLRRAPADRAPVLTVGELELDPAARTCRQDGRDVVLTSREFSLLEFLVRYKGQVMSRWQLAEHVWDAELSPDSNVVEVYVGYLRRKLDIPGQRSLIDTVRGAGYRLRVPPRDDRA